MATETKVVVQKQSRKGVRILTVVVAAIVALATTWVLWRRQIVISHLPPVVATDNLELAEQIRLAQNEALSFVHPVRGLIKLSRLYHANGAYDQALQCYAGLRRLQPGNAKWPHLEANLAALYGRMEDAIPREARAVELAPDYVPARLRLAGEYQKSSRWKEARTEFSNVLKISKDNPYALLGIALCNIQDGDWNGASDTLRRAIDTNPEFVGAMSLMVTVYDHYGDRANAEAFRQIIGRREFIDLEDPWVDDLMDDCYDAYRISVVAAVRNFAGHSDIAKELLLRAVQLEPKAATYHRQYGKLLFNEGNLPEARRELGLAVQLEATSNDAWLLLYQVEKAMQDLPTAAATLERALANCPKSASLHLERAHLMRSYGNDSAEEAELRASYAADMRNGQPLQELALLYLRQNRVNDAIASLEESLLRQPESPHAIGIMTYCYIKAGDEAAAIRWWTEHVQRQPKVPLETKQSLQQEFQQKFGHPLP